MPEPQEPYEILEHAYKRASTQLDRPFVDDPTIQERVERICRNLQNRALARFLLACLLAKVHRPEIDIRKPYTEIGEKDCYSGRTYDERYVTKFILEYELPCNPTTAFLTPALRNRNIILTPDVNLVGRPATLYADALQLLTDVYEGKVLAGDLLAEVVRCLIRVRDERKQRLESLVNEVKSTTVGIALSAEAIVKLIQQHLACKGASRLPVLIVAAAYKAAEQHLGERVLPLQPHTAADRQTGTLGDIEVTLINDDNVIASYEMKTRRVTIEDIERSLQKIRESGKRVDHYVFITTDVIDEEVQNFAFSLYEKTGIEFAILDCIGFLRHFLHLFHRLRMQFLDAYQELLLSEPDSSVSQPVKEAFLALRLSAQS